jgi:hypothetical protein
VGVRGQKAGFKVKETPGVMYALKFGASGFNAIWSKPIKGQLDGASPAIGPDGGLYFGSSDRIGSFKQLNPFRPRQNVADADPVFYGVLDAEDI